MRVTTVLALSMLTAACQPIVEETPTPTPVTVAPVIMQSQLVPASTLIIMGTGVTGYTPSNPDTVTVNTSCCPQDFSVREVSYVGTALWEKWFVDLNFESTSQLWNSTGSAGAEQFPLQPITNSPGVWTDDVSSQSPFALDPFDSNFADGLHTVQVFVSNGFLNPAATSSVAPYAPVDGGSVVSYTWVIDKSSCGSTRSCTGP